MDARTSQTREGLQRCPQPFRQGRADAGGDGRNRGVTQPEAVGKARGDQEKGARPSSPLPGEAGLQARLLGTGPHGQQGPGRASRAAMVKAQ